MREFINRAPLILTQTGVFVYLLTIPFGRSSGVWVQDIVLLTVATGLILSRIIRCGDSSPAPFRLLYPILVFAATILISILFSQYRDISLSMAAYVPIGFLFFFAMQDIAITSSSYRRIFVILTIIIFLLGLDGIYQYVTGWSLLSGSPLFAGRVTGGLPHPNDLALIPVLLPFSITLLLLEKSRTMKVFIFISTLLALVTVILSQSRNAWLGLAAGSVVFLFYAKARKIVVGITCIILILFSISFYFDLGNVQQRLTSLMHVTSDGRVGIWLVAWEMFKESPLLGKGIHTFGKFYLTYIDKVRLPVAYVPEMAEIPWAHNLYLEILAERGLVGIIGFLTLILANGVVLFNFLRHQATFQGKTFAYGLTSSLFTFLIMGLFDLTFLKDWVLLIFLLITALIARLPMLNSSFFCSRTD